LAHRHIATSAPRLPDLRPIEPQLQDDLFIHHEFRADPGQEPLRLDRFITDRLSNVSRTRVQAAITAEAVQVNGKGVKPNYKVKPGDHITIVLDYPPSEFEVAPENIPLDIVFEDEHLVVLNKPAGLVVHPGVGNWTGTLVNGLLYHLGRLPAQAIATAQPSKGVAASPLQGALRPGLVHRLDKDTSGLMVVAKNEVALTHLAKQFFDRTIKRSYVALVWGDIEQDAGEIVGHIGRHLRHRQLMDVFPEGDHGKPAQTHYTVIERFHYVTLVECRLRTGRTHQIRVHMKYLGHPVFNDEVYGGDRIVSGTIHTRYKQFVEDCFSVLPRQALHARSLGFIHPVTHQEMEFTTNLPEDMNSVVEMWRTYVT
jgi:23S rRNA pseudouridine1911/1915/1917 synthase